MGDTLVNRYIRKYGGMGHLDLILVRPSNGWSFTSGRVSNLKGWLCIPPTVAAWPAESLQQIILCSLNPCWSLTWRYSAHSIFREFERSLTSGWQNWFSTLPHCSTSYFVWSLFLELTWPLYIRTQWQGWCPWVIFTSWYWLGREITPLWYSTCLLNGDVIVICGDQIENHSCQTK